MEQDAYGRRFRRVRLEAADRLALPELARPEHAANAIGISRAMLDAIESGKKRPSFETLEMMAVAYNLQMGDLLPSSAPRGPEVDRIIGPLATISEPYRSMFITQMAAFARTLSSALISASDDGRDSIRAANNQVVPAERNIPSVGVSSPLSNDEVGHFGEGVPHGPRVNANGSSSSSRSTGSGRPDHKRKPENGE